MGGSVSAAQMKSDYDSLKLKELSDVDIYQILKEKYSENKTVEKDHKDDEDNKSSESDDRKERSRHTVMISLQVSSMKNSAMILKKILEDQGN